MKARKQILFVYRFNYLNEVLPHYRERGRVPTEFLYGLGEIDEDRFEARFVNSPQGARAGWARRLGWLIDWPSTFLIRIGCPVEIYPLFRKELRSADVIFCVNDPISFSVLLWKRLGFIHGDVHAIVQSAHERYEKHFRLKLIMKRVVGWLLRGASVIYVFSNCAKQPVVEYFGVDPLKIHTFPFGMDVNFWKPGNVERQSFILSIGSDMNRDYDTLIDALPDDKQLILITTKEVKIKAKDVIVKRGLSNEDVRDHYQKAGVVVVPSVSLKYEFAGQSCALQAAACGASLIVSDSPPMREVLREGEHCLYYEPENPESLRDKLEYARTHPQEMWEMGRRAREHVLRTRTPRHAAEHLQNVILSGTTRGSEVEGSRGDWDDAASSRDSSLRSE